MPIPELPPEIKIALRSIATAHAGDLDAEIRRLADTCRAQPQDLGAAARYGQRLLLRCREEMTQWDSSGGAGSPDRARIDETLRVFDRLLKVRPESAIFLAYRSAALDLQEYYERKTAPKSTKKEEKGPATSGPARGLPRPDEPPASASREEAESAGEPLAIDTGSAETLHLPEQEIPSPVEPDEILPPPPAPPEPPDEEQTPVSPAPPADEREVDSSSPPGVAAPNEPIETCVEETVPIEEEELEVAPAGETEARTIPEEETPPPLPPSLGSRRAPRPRRKHTGLFLAFGGLAIVIFVAAVVFFAGRRPVSHHPPDPDPGTTTGALVVHVTPSAEIVVDGWKSKPGSNVSFSGLSPGTHKVIAQKPGYFKEERNITIHGGSTSTIRIRLARKR